MSLSLRCLLALALLTGIFAAPAIATPALAAATAGQVDSITGTVTRSHKDGQAAALKAGDSVDTGDEIVTGAKSGAKVTLADGTEITLGSGNRFFVDRFAEDGAPQGNTALRILGGAFSYVGGSVEKAPQSSVTIGLDFGSIGVRGTTLYRAMKDGQCWIYLQQGKIDVFNKGGRVTLQPGDGTRMKAKTIGPAAPHVWTPQEINWIKSAVDASQQ
ncbi:MAG: FecR domain-containing protein [Micavibrio sp.]|nr:FecR domain-containing protein [Micavibrio sp.]